MTYITKLKQDYLFTKYYCMLVCILIEEIPYSWYVRLLFSPLGKLAGRAYILLALISSFLLNDFTLLLCLDGCIVCNCLQQNELKVLVFRKS